MRNYNYLLYRRGSNAANQPCTFDWVPFAIVSAPSRSAAARVSWHGERPSVYSAPTPEAEVVARTGSLAVYANQSIRAVPSSRASAADWNAVLEADAMQRLDEQ